MQVRPVKIRKASVTTYMVSEVEVMTAMRPMKWYRPLKATPNIPVGDSFCCPFNFAVYAGNSQGGALLAL